MPRESQKADPADAVVPTELATANASMVPASGPRTTEGPAVADLGSRLSADRVQFAKEREPARSAEPIGGAALPTDRPEMIFAERLVARAERLIDLRDVGGARLLLERAVSLGHGRSAHLLAQTYDPSMLRAWGIVGMNGDLIKAKELYDRAKTGAPYRNSIALRPPLRRSAMDQVHASDGQRHDGRPGTLAPEEVVWFSRSSCRDKRTPTPSPSSGMNTPRQENEAGMVADPVRWGAMSAVELYRGEFGAIRGFWERSWTAGA